MLSLPYHHTLSPSAFTFVQFYTAPLPPPLADAYKRTQTHNPTPLVDETSLSSSQLSRIDASFPSTAPLITPQSASPSPPHSLSLSLHYSLSQTPSADDNTTNVEGALHSLSTQELTPNTIAADTGDGDGDCTGGSAGARCADTSTSSGTAASIAPISADDGADVIRVRIPRRNILLRVKRRRSDCTSDAASSGADESAVALFAGVSFVVSGVSGKSEYVQLNQHIRTEITRCGGTLVDALDDTTTRLPALIFLCNRPLRTAKSVFAIARGTPPIKLEWIDACTQQRRRLPTDAFLLPLPALAAGDAPSQYKRQTLRSLRRRRFLSPTERTERICIRMIIALIGAADFVDEWRHVVVESGATYYDIALSPAPLECHIILIQTKRRRQPINVDKNIRERAAFDGVALLNIDWLVDSVIDNAKRRYEQYLCTQ